ncbi:solute carrier family 2 [Huso huso]|uniref:Solute carrier family 2 n=1 Tax=Huso huso TaxID=61971 RepID=A0ABR0YV87_HUSHU
MTVELLTVRQFLGCSEGTYLDILNWDKWGYNNRVYQLSDIDELSNLQGSILVMTICAAGIGGTFQYGYNISVINAPTMHRLDKLNRPQCYIQTFINETWLERTGTPLESHLITLLWSIIVSVYPLGGLIGALIAGPLAVQFGRKTLLLLNNLFVILSAVLVLASRACRSFEMIILSQVFAGVNAGLSMNVQPMYLGESAPKKLQGAVSMSSASFTALGIVLGQVIGLREILGSEWCWPLLLASNAIPGLVQLVTLSWLLESPRYLLIDKNNKEACLKALRRLRGNVDLSAEMDEMLEEQAAVKGERAKRPWELFQDRSVRWQLITVMVLSSAMQLCGNDSMYFYASYVFQEAGIPYDKIQYVVIGTGSCELITSITCVNLSLHLVTAQALHLYACFLVDSVPEKISWMPYMSMGCMFAYILSFGIGPAIVTGILPTEIFDQNSRPAAYMISGSLMWSMLFLVGMLFPFIVALIGQFCFLIFMMYCVLAAAFTLLFVPETKGKTMLEIAEDFNKLNFKGRRSEVEGMQKEDFIIATKL